MNLEFDVGNSRVKYRVCNSASETLSRGFCLHQDLDNLSAQDIWQASSYDASLNAMLVSCVAGGEVRSSLVALAQRLGVAAVFAETKAECSGVTNSYDQPDKMGVDRWLAMIAAYQIAQSAICVVDCGTALTIDFVSRSGCHEGGLILPGSELLLSSLLRDTDKVRFDEKGVGQMRLGRSTEAAVHNGVLYMLVGAIHEAIGQHGAERLSGGDKFDDPMSIFLTGGMAPTLEPLLRYQVQYRPELVMDGLKHVV